MEVIVKIDRRNKQAKAFYEYMRSLPFIQVEDVSDKPDLNTTQDEIIEISKKVNQEKTKKWFDKLGIDYDSHS